MTAPSIKEALELKPCPFCGKSATMEQDESNYRWSVGCNAADETACMGYQSFTTFARRSEAVKAWNTRATLSPPAGERREAIARLIDPIAFRPKHIIGEGLSETEKEKWLRARNVAYYTADAILASGLVQNEASWRDISTAPKDGTAFLAWESKDRGPFKCWWHTRWPEPEAYWMDHNDSEPNPTHWKPLDPDPLTAIISEASQHIGWLKQFIYGMTPENWRDMKLRAERQLDELSKSVSLAGRAALTEETGGGE